MDKVLIVDSDERFLEKLLLDFSRLRQFSVITASHGENALELLMQGDVSVLVTDIHIPGIDGLEILAQVTRKHFNTPCIVLSRFKKPWFFKIREQRENLYYVEKPTDAVSLASAIMVALSIRDEGHSFEGFGLSSFLPIVELAEKTCCMEVFSRGKGTGYLYFEKGVLVDALYKNFLPDQAVGEMLGWHGVELFFSELVGDETRIRLNKKIMEMVGASWDREQVLGTGGADGNGGKRGPMPADLFDLQCLAEKYFVDQFARLGTIKGYRALGIVDSEMGLIAGHDPSDILNFGEFRSKTALDIDFASMFANLEPVGRCKTICALSGDFVTQITCCDRQFSKPVFIVGVTGAGGNWIFLKHEIDEINKYLSRFSGKRTAAALSEFAVPFGKETAPWKKESMKE
jgi:CheY-like chemotaxis protein